MGDPLSRLVGELSRLPGIGPKLERTLGKLFGRGESGARVIDLMFHAPSGLIDRSYRPTIAELPQHGIVTLEIQVDRHRPPPRHNKRVPYRVDCLSSGRVRA